MELILAASQLKVRAGSETYMITIGAELQRLGHEVTLHALWEAEDSTLSAAAGLRFAARAAGLPREPDAIVVQDATSSHTLRQLYPATPQLFVAHSATHDLQLPPQISDAVQRIVVMNDRVRARLEAAAVQVPITRLRQPIDVLGFSSQRSLPEAPSRALAFSSRLTTERREVLSRACAEAEIEFSVLGAAGTPSEDPAQDLQAADIVFGYGRSVLEAMSCGRAAYVYDHLGGDGWVTAETYARLEADGFGGRAGLGPVDAERLARDLADFDPQMGRANRDLIVTHHGADRHAQELVALLRELAPRAAERQRDPGLELARLVRAQWVTESTSSSLADEVRTLRSRMGELEATAARLPELERVRGLEAAAARLPELERIAAEAQTAVETMLSMKRYRAGAALGRALDRARSVTRRRRSRRLLALVPFKNEIRFLPGLFENLAGQVDGVIALDDGSTDGSREFVEGQPGVLELLYREREGDSWSDGKDHERLVRAAWEHRADWLLGIDADERVERHFRARAELEFERADVEALIVYLVHLRELWDRPNQMRVDSLWGQKRKINLFRSMRDHVFDQRDLHGHWGPLNKNPDEHFPEADLFIYHLRMIEASDREERRAKWERLDPDRKAQSIGYAYMTDVEGIELEPLPPGRDYVPMS